MNSLLSILFILCSLFIFQQCNRKLTTINYVFDGKGNIIILEIPNNMKVEKDSDINTDTSKTCIRNVLCITGFDNISWKEDSLGMNNYRNIKLEFLLKLFHEVVYTDDRYYTKSKLDSLQLREDEILSYLGKPNYVEIDTNAIDIEVKLEDHFKKTYLYITAGGFYNEKYVGNPDFVLIFNKSGILVRTSVRVY